MATTGEVYPTLGETASESPWSDNDWVTPENIYVNDGNTASVTAATFDSGDQTRVLKATGFDFSIIPDGSTIDGVILRVNNWYANGGVSIDLASLLDTSKARVGDNKYATPHVLTTDTAHVDSAGGATDTWGNSLTAAWVKNSSFGVGLGYLATPVKDSDVFVDYVTLEIYYTAPSGPTPDAYNKLLYTSEPPTPNAWNQLKQDSGTGWKKILYI